MKNGTRGLFVLGIVMITLSAIGVAFGIMFVYEHLFIPTLGDDTGIDKLGDALHAMSCLCLSVLVLPGIASVLLSRRATLSRLVVNWVFAAIAWTLYALVLMRLLWTFLLIEFSTLTVTLVVGPFVLPALYTFCLVRCTRTHRLVSRADEESDDDDR